MCAEVYKRCDGCENEEPGQQSHDFYLLVDPVTKATECFNELCFKKVFEMIPISVRDIIVIRNRKTFRFLWLCWYWFIYESRKARSSRPDVFCKKGVLRNFTKFTFLHTCPIKTYT